LESRPFLFPDRETEQAMTSIRSPQQLGDALRAARKQLWLTQPRLALLLGIDALGGEVQRMGLPASPAANQPKSRPHDT